eukprot:SM000006S19545  [mRNA]  locus=s6:1425804:1426361:+ [translate_table: standard]
MGSLLHFPVVHLPPLKVWRDEPVGARSYATTTHQMPPETLLQHVRIKREKGIQLVLATEARGQQPLTGRWQPRKPVQLQQYHLPVILLHNSVRAHLKAPKEAHQNLHVQCMTCILSTDQTLSISETDKKILPSSS